MGPASPFYVGVHEQTPQRMWLGQTLAIRKRVMYAHQIHGFNPLVDCKGPCVRSSDSETSRSSGQLGGGIIISSKAKRSSWPHLHRQILTLSLLLVTAVYCLSASASASDSERAVPEGAARSAVSDDASCQSADLLLHNARVYTPIDYTVHESEPVIERFEAVAIKDGTFVFVGSNASAEAWRCGASKVIDLKESAVYPGFTDSHQHLEGVGRRTKTLSPGDRRVYARSDKFEHRSIVEAMRGGRTMATNGGPVFAFMKLNGKQPGDRLKRAEAQGKTVSLNVHSLNTLRSVALYFNGARVAVDDFVNRYGIEYTPTLVFLDADGADLGHRIVGIQTVDYFGGLVDDAIRQTRIELRSASVETR